MKVSQKQEPQILTPTGTPRVPRRFLSVLGGSAEGRKRPLRSIPESGPVRMPRMVLDNRRTFWRTFIFGQKTRFPHDFRLDAGPGSWKSVRGCLSLLNMLYNYNEEASGGWGGHQAGQGGGGDKYCPPT